MPKGGGRYKVGSPYRINGKVYRPSEVRHYDEKGIASWYGKLFHGRRTANGEIYDMEALTAAHPTLPLPSYVRVTNLRNGRSLIVRVNDRGPYARNRIIDLSWAVASLLQMRGAGTAPVRVQYVGRAPLSGDDSHERAVLARQPWAGPRVAYAKSPAKAMRYRQASSAYRYSVTRSRKTATLPTEPSYIKRPAKETALSTLPLPVSRSASLKKESLASHNIQLMHANPTPSVRRKPDQQNFTSTRPKKTGASPKSISSASSQHGNAALHPSGYYVEAGLFHKKLLAERLAKVLVEIAPAAVDSVDIGNRAVHRVRLGPFPHTEAAQKVAERIRKAGLTGARVEDAVNG